MNSVIMMIVNWLIRENIISKEDESIYHFGLKQAAWYMLNILTFIVIGVIADVLWGVIIYIGIYSLLRPYAGGYHAESAWSCYLTSVIMVIAASLFMKSHAVSLPVLAGITLVLCSVMMVLCPVEDHHKPLDEEEKKVYRDRFRIYLCIEVMLTIVAWLFNYIFIAEAAAIGMVSVGLVVIAGWLKNRLRRTVHAKRV